MTRACLMAAFVTAGALVVAAIICTRGSCQDRIGTFEFETGDGLVVASVYDDCPADRAGVTVGGLTGSAFASGFASVSIPAVGGAIRRCRTATTAIRPIPSSEPTSLTSSWAS